MQMFIVSRDNMTQLKPCDKLRAACLDFLCAILLQPIWRHASSSRPLLMEIVDVLAPLVRHESQDLAEKVRDCGDGDSRALACCVCMFCTSANMH